MLIIGLPVFILILIFLWYKKKKTKEKNIHDDIYPMW